MRFSFSILPCCFIALACSAPHERNNGATAPGAEEDSLLRAFLDSYYETMSERDWENYRGKFWGNATITTAWQGPGDTSVRVHVTTIDDFIRQAPDGPDSQPVFSERMTSAEIDVRKNLASAWVKYDAEFGRRDSLLRWSGTDIFTLLKNDGEWRIASLVFESN